MNELKLTCRGAWLWNDDYSYSLNIQPLCGYEMIDDEKTDVAHRIVACVNAAVGIDTEILERGAVNMLELSAARASISVWQGEAMKATQQRDDLMAALELAQQFISNGTELGFIRMPDADTPDLALKTPGLISAAIAKAKGDDARPRL